MKEIVISAPGMNALNGALMASLIAQLKAADGAPILLTGEGRAFCAGLNLKELLSLDEAGLAEFLGLLAELCHTLYHYPGPTVAYVNGHAIAGGCLLTLFCDYRVVADNAKIRLGLNEIALGVNFPPNILTMVQRRLPRSKVSRVLLGGQLHDPQGAKAMGIVDEVSEDAEGNARAYLKHLASHPPEAYALMKAALRNDDLGSEVDRDLTAELASQWASDTVRNRLKAVLGL